MSLTLRWRADMLRDTGQPDGERAVDPPGVRGRGAARSSHDLPGHAARMRPSAGELLLGPPAQAF